MLVTIFADASFCPETKAAGWGGYIVCGRGRWNGGGGFKDKPITNIEAEAKAVVNALHTAVTQNLVLHFDNVLIQCDCQGIWDYFDATADDIEIMPDHKKAVVDAFQRIVRSRTLGVELRWVRGHEGNISTRNYANEVCDKHAKSHMRKARRKLGYRKSDAKSFAASRRRRRKKRAS